MNRRNVKSYIDRVIKDAYESIGRPGDECNFKYDYLILGGHLLFATVSSDSSGVEKRVYHRLLRNLPKNFGLLFEVVKSENWYDGKCSGEFDIEPVDSSIGSVTPGKTLYLWNLFGKRYSVNLKFGLRYRQSTVDMASKVIDAIDKCYEAMLNMEDDQRDCRTEFGLYIDTWKEIIGLTPLEQFIELEKIELENENTKRISQIQYGSTPTPFIPPDPATELVKLEKYYGETDQSQTKNNSGE